MQSQVLERNSTSPGCGRLFSFAEFLAELFPALRREGVQPCVLRNYEGFPASNIGSDIDLLIPNSRLPNAVKALSSIQGIRIVGFVERFYVAHLFIEGVSGASESPSLQLDFIWSLNWKGQPYLPAQLLLKSSLHFQAGKVDFMVPAPIHEAIASLMNGLLNGGIVKERYFARVQGIFSNFRSEAIQALSPQFGADVAGQLLDTVAIGNRSAIMASAKSLRAALLRRSFLAGPYRCIRAAGGYVLGELAVRRLPRSLETIRIVGHEWSDRERVVETIVARLQNAAKTVEWHQPARASWAKVSLPHLSSARHPLASTFIAWMYQIAASLRWVVEGWSSRFGHRRCLTIAVWDSCCCEPKSLSADNGTWLVRQFVHCVHGLVPNPDLRIVLGPTSEKVKNILDLAPWTHREDCETDPDDPRRKRKVRVVFLDANQESASLIEAAYAAIVDALAQRANAQLKRRFPQLDVPA